MKGCKLSISSISLRCRLAAEKDTLLDMYFPIYTIKKSMELSNLTNSIIYERINILYDKILKSRFKTDRNILKDLKDSCIDTAEYIELLEQNEVVG